MAGSDFSESTSVLELLGGITLDNTIRPRDTLRETQRKRISSQKSELQAQMGNQAMLRLCRKEPKEIVSIEDVVQEGRRKIHFEVGETTSPNRIAQIYDKIKAQIDKISPGEVSFINKKNLDSWQEQYETAKAMIDKNFSPDQTISKKNIIAEEETYKCVWTALGVIKKLGGELNRSLDEFQSYLAPKQEAASVSAPASVAASVSAATPEAASAAAEAEAVSVAVAAAEAERLKYAEAKKKHKLDAKIEKQKPKPAEKEQFKINDYVKKADGVVAFVEGSVVVIVEHYQLKHNKDMAVLAKIRSYGGKSGSQLPGDWAAHCNIYAKDIYQYVKDKLSDLVGKQLNKVRLDRIEAYICVTEEAGTYFVTYHGNPPDK